ncbi:hypothetical protein IAR50_000856 [Cryptococcus sp. DSM 104548]
MPSNKRPPPSPLPPNRIDHLSAKYFTPFFKPQRLVPAPSPPSLAWSKLPPPAAEIDERPRARVRRFRLWGQAAPELRVIALDPRRRAWLVRYRSFVVPSPPDSEQSRLVPSSRPFVITPQPLTPPSTPLLTPLPTPTSSPSPSSPKPHGKAPVDNPTRPLPIPPRPPPPEQKLSKKERARQHEKLLEHKWVLDMEHERRFRAGMGAMMKLVMYFQELNTTEFFQAIRKDSSNIYKYVNPQYLPPVPMRDQVHKQVRKYEKQEKKRKKKKEEKKRLEKEAQEKVLAKERQRVEEYGREKDAQKAVQDVQKVTKVSTGSKEDHHEVSMVRVTRSRGSPRSSPPTSPLPSRSPSVFNDPVLKDTRKLIQELPETGDIEMARLVQPLCQLRDARADLLRRANEKEKRKRQKMDIANVRERDRARAEVRHVENISGSRRASKSDPHTTQEDRSAADEHTNSSDSSPSINTPTPRRARPHHHHYSRTPSLSETPIQFRPGSLNIDDDTALPSLPPAPSIPDSAISFPYSDGQRSDEDTTVSRASFSDLEDGRDYEGDAAWDTEVDLIVREGAYGEYGTLNDDEILSNLTELDNELSASRGH